MQFPHLRTTQFFISFNIKDEKTWLDLKALENYYQFPNQFFIMDEWSEFVDTFEKLSIADKPYRSLSLCALTPDAVLTLETDDKILEVLKVQIDSKINEHLSGNKKTIAGPLDLELQVRDQWHSQKALHRLFIQQQINRLVDEIKKD